ncbi:unnamed protein product [Lymnaea stagnalis]|uniref:Peptidase M1 leukotriene A4 hydrolase/aminopeptidase C-terminal domain-containing protein n=1 Tax=Lymnaea stagnalis TaxID=6523 RepID=A0AAV2HP75_LYMST
MAGLRADNVDVATSSNFKDVRATHLHLDLSVLFEEKKVIGFLRVSLKSLKNDIATVILDVHEKLSVSQVREQQSGASLEFSIQPFANYGQSLTIKLAHAKSIGDEFILEIDYVVSQGGPAVSWLEPQQTADKVKPFMYTQGQSVLNRSFFPCQDTPAVKATYSAFVKVPEGLTAVMSANRNSFGDRGNRAGDKNCFFFEQTTPIQSYLIALAVGFIKSARIGPRSHVWAEPSVLDKAHAEFDGIVEEFLATGERIFSEYVWEKYDILIMPPSFPYGGMENPCLTFVTPCIVVGDKSLVDVVIHEITHSWFGNLVTNGNWSEFWLNEGFTMFGQRRIEEEIYGHDLMCLEAKTGQELLRKHIDNEGENAPLTKLRVIIEPGVDPDDTYNETPYEKGFAFVCYLRSLVGDNNAFDGFLRAYIQKFKYQSIVSEDLFEFYLDYFPELREQRVHEKPGFEFVATWLNGTGWPPYTPDISAHRILTAEGDKAVLSFTSLNTQTEAPEMKSWKAYQLMYFLDEINQTSLPKEGLQRILQEYPQVHSSPNAEIRLRWCELVIKNELSDNFEDIRQFLHSQGKKKYTKPLYQAMVKGSDELRQLAVKVFQETQDFLHPSVREDIREILPKTNNLTSNNMAGLQQEDVDDVATCSNFKEVRTTHLHLDMTINFDDSKITGWLKLSLKSLVNELGTVILDAQKNLAISQIKETQSQNNLDFVIEPFASYGTRLIIKLLKPKQKGETFDLEIEFVSNPGGAGVSWLTPQQTADKKKPFMYTQGQSVLNRSIFPCQDTPAVKATYSAFVKVPEGFTAVMSANRNSFGDRENRAGDKNCFYFELTIPIPSYLIALAVGDIKSASIGPRSHVWAEPSVLDRAQREFDGIERFIQKGEELFGEYVWEKYDILIMPHSFPYGGMENPCLTFVTPCLVVGDKSMIDVAIHEITHSWFGNLVTNANWSEFWLNEGLTMFGQRRIEEECFGNSFMCLEAKTRRELLRKHIEREGNDAPLTRLRVIIEAGVDPDDTYNETPYEKGFAFVCYLRSLVGDNNAFDKFLKAYVQKFQYQSIVAENLFEFYLDYFPQLREQRVYEKSGFEFVATWLKGTGWPPYTPDLSAHQELTSDPDKAVEILTSNYVENNTPDISQWIAQQRIYLLDELTARSPLPRETKDKILRDYPLLHSSHNSEIRQRWCELVIKNDMVDQTEDVRQFLHSQGKQKHTKPLYEAMASGSDTFKQLALKVYGETKDSLHQNMQGVVESILKKYNLM